MSESAAATVQRITRKARFLSRLHPDDLVAIEFILDDAIRHRTRARDHDLLMRLRVTREARERRVAH